MKTLLAVSAFIWTCAPRAADFFNLRFDEPDLSRLARDPKTGGHSAPIGDMLPGWEVSIRPAFGEWQPYTGVVELSLAIGGTPVALSTYSVYQGSGFGVSMQAIPAIGFPGLPDPPEVLLSTKGTVPANAKFFEWYAGAPEVTVSDGSHQVTVPGRTGILNVSQFAGKDVTISFLNRSGGSEMFDIIGFTQTATEKALSPPSKLRHTSLGKESVTLTWAPSTDGIMGYEVFSAPNLETPFTNRISSKLITENSYTYSSADVTDRYYQVRAVGVSSRSGIAVTKYSIGATCHVP